MYSRILVPLDGSKLAEQILPYVRLMIPVLTDRVSLLRVIEPPPPDISVELNPTLNSHRTLTFIVGVAQKYLEDARRSLGDLGADISIQTRNGGAAWHIIEAAEEEPGTLIAMCTHGRSGIGRWFLGSVMDKVVRSSRTPVLIIRASEPENRRLDPDISRVVVTLEGTEAAENVIPHAAALASGLGIGVTLLRVVPTSKVRRYFDTVKELGDSFEEVSRAVTEQAWEYTREAAKKFQGLGIEDAEPRVVQGDPAEVIVDLSRDSPGSIIAMTTHSESGIQRLVLGSVADRVVRRSSGPVLLVPVGVDSEDGG